MIRTDYLQNKSLRQMEEFRCPHCRYLLFMYEPSSAGGVVSIKCRHNKCGRVVICNVEGQALDNSGITNRIRREAGKP